MWFEIQNIHRTVSLQECIDEDPDSWRIQMVSPIYFSYGIIFWISILFVWGLELFNYCSNSNQPVWTFLFMNYILYTFEKRNNCYSFIVKWNFQYFFQNSEVPSSRKAKSNIRSLSEAKSEDISDKINKRFDRAEAIEDYDSRSGSNDTLVKRNSAFTKPPAYNQIPASSSANTGGMYLLIKISIITRFIFIIQNYVGKIIP